MIDLANEIAEMRNQLTDCFPDEADEIAELHPRDVVRGAARHFGLSEWANGGDPDEAGDLYHALVNVSLGVVSHSLA